MSRPCSAPASSSAARTNTPEFGPLTVAENSRYGNTLNPWDTSRASGGSSGGASAAVAGEMFPIAHANDGGGSIRIPAAYCGLVGLKSSRGRIPRRAQTWMGAVVEGAITRTVADAAASLDVTAGPDPLAWYSAPAPQRPFAEEVGAPVETPADRPDGRGAARRSHRPGLRRRPPATPRRCSRSSATRWSRSRWRRSPRS